MVGEPFSSREPETDAVARLLKLAGPRPPVPEERAARVKAAAREVWTRSVARERRRRGVVGLAALLTAAGLVLVFSRPAARVGPKVAPPVVAVVEVARGLGAGTGSSPASLHVGTAVRAGEAITTPAGAGLSLRLTVGSSVRLDAGTRLRLVSAVELALERGAVYVDTGEAGRGVRVATPLGTVTDVGTQFETRLSPAELRVRVRAGRVTVAGHGEAETAAAGEELTLDRSGEVHRTSVPVSGSAWDWALGLSPAFDVDGQTLGVFLQRLQSETHWRLRFSPRSLEAEVSTIVLHGSLADLEPEEALAAALATSGLRAERRPDGFVIERSAEPATTPATAP
jgi:ferric-dicitrate binding protein FerR (iron transport regulator)